MGQYWVSPSGYRFFLQWVPPEGIYIDQDHAQSILTYLIDGPKEDPYKPTIVN
ncbi:hypothetical protein GL4_0456 [Methyloceanibacter caenitepidi]|uniref:Uncharacterized protein n=1 Tax=Methyloceanibacter caenitepidi TaxID=1384459 RepID=A0A0A8JYQ5_9HYPH|nr:hypothetical protein GL4_0456 [Methyloceanibacter caenitepidi]